MTPDRKNLRAWLILVVAVAIFTRASLWLVYPVAIGNDTATYQHLANSLRNNQGFERYNGTRTPAYPLFLMAAGSSERAYLWQLALGLVTTLLVFWIAWQASGRAWFAGLLALAHTLNLGQLFFEATLLTEGVATFLLFAVLAGLFWLFEKPGNKPALVALFVGLAGAALALTRPLFAFLPFLGAIFLLFFLPKTPFRLRFMAAVLGALPALVILAAWIIFIYLRFNILGLDSIGGYHLVNHTSSFFERTPDDYAAIRDTFLQFRAQRIAETGSAVNTIWDAIPDLMKQTRLNYYALGRVMGQISSQLIRENPGLYLQNLILGWWWFWKVGVIWLPGAFTNQALGSWISTLLLAERYALFGYNMLFLSGSLALAWPGIRRLFKPTLFTWFAICSIWVTSVLQTLAEHGDNPRFLAPMQTLVVLLVSIWLLQIIRNRYQDKPNPVEQTSGPLS